MKIFKIWSNGENQPEVFSALNNLNSDVSMPDTLLDQETEAESSVVMWK